ALPKANETPAAHLYNRSVELGRRQVELPVRQRAAADLHPTLADQPPRLGAGYPERLAQGSGEMDRVLGGHRRLGHVVGHLVLDVHLVEALLGAAGRILALEA